MEFSALGDQAIVVTFGQKINMEIYKQVQSLFETLQNVPFAGMIECVPSYTSVTIYYDAYILHREKKINVSPYDYVCDYVQSLLQDETDKEMKEYKYISIPVCYGGEYGPDLEEVAKHHGLTTEDVIRIHSESTYFVYMLGFTPGFPYLGGMSQRIATPRKHTPRLKIPAGSVGIGGSQTGIYPLETPGGWNIIGRTPISLFRPQKVPPTYLQSGMYLRFIPITETEFQQWEDGNV
ncbi:kinase [Bacillus pseudomycoides]|nr:kinase [Bacillus pseudomycoides]